MAFPTMKQMHLNIHKRAYCMWIMRIHTASRTMVSPSKKSCFPVRHRRHIRFLDAQVNVGEQWRRAGDLRRNGFSPGSSSKTRRPADAE